MRVTYRIPTKDQYAFVEVTEDIRLPANSEISEKEVVHTRYTELTEQFKGGEGIGLKALAKVIHEYCTTGGIVNGGMYDFSEKEKLLIGEVKKLIRKNA